MIAMIPYLLGFTPTDSIVLVALQGPRRRFGPCLRMDLAPPAEAMDQVHYLMSIIEAQPFGPVLLGRIQRRPGQGSRSSSTAAPWTGTSRRDRHRGDPRRRAALVPLTPAAIQTVVIRTARPMTAKRQVMSAQAVVSGMTKAASRDTLRDQFEPYDLGLCAEVSEHCQRLSAADALRVFAELMGDSLRLPAELSARAARQSRFGGPVHGGHEPGLELDDSRQRGRQL
ncbi:MAG: DUF4192 family protein [Nocardioidaceae bacterium]